MSGMIVKQGIINGQEYSGFITPLGNQFMASIVAVGDVTEKEHYTKLSDSKEQAEANILETWAELEKASIQAP